MSKLLSPRARLACVAFLGIAALSYLPGTETLGRDEEGHKLGALKADRILFLGNSVALHPPLPSLQWTGNWGMFATARDKDYVHLLAAKIGTESKGNLFLEPKPAKGDEGVGNILNVADILERGYATYEPSKIRKQLDWKADIVVVQCGENVPSKEFDGKKFQKAFGAMLDDLKSSSNPHIFVTGNILSGNPDLDEIKRKVCAEDSAHRTFVDIADYRKDIPANGPKGHPNDRGMALIADTIYAAIASRADKK